MDQRPYIIAVLGLWHLGEIYSASLAEIGHRVFGIAQDPDLIKNFSKGNPPLTEPDLSELIVSNQSKGRLSYTTDFGKIGEADVLWITFDAPVDEEDNVDLAPIFDGLKTAAPHLQNGILVVITSQVPVGTHRRVVGFLRESRPDLKFDYVYVPENLRLGEAVGCFMNPGRIVVGAENEMAFQKVEEIFAPLKAPILRMSPASAEMAKHALNAFLATSLGFINEIADFCEASGADVLDVVRALRTDPRIGPSAYLDPSLGFAGGTLGRDLKVLLNIGGNEKRGLIESVYTGNFLRKYKIKSKLGAALNNLKGQPIVIFGLTYKAGTRTLRRSQAIEVAKDLVSAGAVVRLHDPAALEDEVHALISAQFFADPYEAARGAHAVVLMTPWPEFNNLDFAKLKTVMQAPFIFFDTRNFFSGRENEIRRVGFLYWGIGRPFYKEGQ